MSIKKQPQLRDLDPHLEREKERYGHPLPSREFMLQVLKEQGVPVTEAALQSLLGIAAEEHEIFSRRLAAMVREG
ncbi:MAG: ribonuclease R, partial [Pseudomonadota bacterium]